MSKCHLTFYRMSFEQSLNAALLTLGTLNRVIMDTQRNASDPAETARRVRTVLDEFREQVEWIREPLLRGRFSNLAQKLSDWLRADRVALSIQVPVEQRTLTAGTPTLVRLHVTNQSNEPLESIEIALGPSLSYLVSWPRVVRVLRIERLGPGETQVFDERISFQTTGTRQLECVVSHVEADGRRSQKTTELALEVVPAEQIRFVPIRPNPYIAGPPVDAPEMFFGREDMLDFLRDNLIGKYRNNIIILQGNRRTGKSSILKQVVKRDLFAPDVPVYLHCQGMVPFTDQTLFYKIAREIWKTLARYLDVTTVPKVKRSDFSEDDPFDDFQEVLDRLCSSVPRRKVILLIDEFEVISQAIQEGRLSRTVPENLRHLFQHHDLAVVLTGSYRLKRLSQEYWSTLFGLGLKREIGFLEESATRALIAEPLKGLAVFSDEASDRIIQMTACQPYFVQMICHHVVNILNRQETPYVTQAHVEEAAQEALTSASDHMGFMFNSADSTMLKAVLVYMASSLSQPGTLAGYDIEQFAREHRLPLSRAELEKGLRRMADLDIVQIEGAIGQRRYGFKIDLVRQWIRRNYDLRSAIALAQDASYIRED